MQGSRIANTIITNKGARNMINVEYKPEHIVKDKRCHNCLSHVYVEIHKDIDYPYVCLTCDENLYNFETIKEAN
jgi:hypothetical protein